MTGVEQGAGDDVEVAEIVEHLPSGLLAALRTPLDEGGRLCLNLLHVRYSDAHELTRAGLTSAEGPFGTAPFVLTDLGVRVREALLAAKTEEPSTSAPRVTLAEFGGHPR